MRGVNSLNKVRGFFTEGQIFALSSVSVVSSLPFSKQSGGGFNKTGNAFINRPLVSKARNSDVRVGILFE
jgi:hypothetical protein